MTERQPPKCIYCTRLIALGEGEFVERWVHVDTGLPWCLLKWGEA